MGVAMSKARLFREAIACSKRALVTVEDVVDAGTRSQLRMSGTITIGDSHLHLQQFERGLEWATNAIKLAAATPLDGYGAASLVAAHCNAARCLVALGRFDEAKAHASRALELTESPGAERSYADARAVNGLVQVARGERESGSRELEAAIAASRGIKEHHVNALQDKARALEIAGETERALAAHKELVLRTRQLQAEGLQFATMAMVDQDWGPLEPAMTSSPAQSAALLDLARRSRKLLDWTSVPPRPRPSRGYLAKRAKARGQL
jgi:tetratricopeptide (TPR) repeat protein